MSIVKTSEIDFSLADDVYPATAQHLLVHAEWVFPFLALKIHFKKGIAPCCLGSADF
jgi:hypothetical protein